MLKAAGTVGLALLLLCRPSPAWAGELLTGAIRDRAGVAVAGARVTAFDRTGRAVAHDVAIGDGTFALDLPASATTIEIACDYCRSVRRPIGAAGEPLVVIVARYTAVTQDGPSPADIRALPYRSAADIASLRPFAVVRAGRLSDRGLDVYGATLVNGLPFYSPVDGDNYSRLIPAHMVAALVPASPLAAPVYGGYASAGIDNVRLRDPDVAPSRLDGGNAFDLIARANTVNASAVYGVANDDGHRREAASADIDVPFAGGRLALTALDMADSTADATGASLAYVTDSRRYTTAAAVRATQTSDASLVTLDARVRNRGPLRLEFGLRAARGTGDSVGRAAAQDDAALYADAGRTAGALTLSADAAFDRGGDSGTGGTRAGALIGSIASDIRLSSNWSVHSGVVSHLRIPAFAETFAAAPAPGDRSLLFEQSLTYTDRNRLRVAGIGYTQRTTAASTARVNGVGVDAGWQIAPQISLHTWLLRANASATPLFAPPAAYGDTAIAAPLTRQLAWFTYDNGLRADVLVRGGALEGDLRIPLGAAFALALGTATYNGARVTTLGVTQR